jgi:transcriptional regulator with XRE-family HTH domain
MVSAPDSLANYIKSARRERGYSLRDLKRVSGVHNATIQRIEGGFIAVPSPDVLIALVDALDLDLITALKLIPAYRNMLKRIVSAIREGGIND